MQSSISTTDVFPMSIGDHDIIGCVRKINTAKFKQKWLLTSRNYKNYNPEELNKDFEDIIWDDLYETQNVNKALTIFDTIVKRLSTNTHPSR